MAKTRALRNVIEASVGKEGQWNNTVVIHIRFIAGWIVHRLLCNVEKRQYSEDSRPDRTVEAQQLQLLQWFDTSTGRSIGGHSNLGPGVRLVRPQNIFVTFLLKLERHLQLELLRPADIIEHRADVFSNALHQLSVSHCLRDMWSRVMY